MADEIIAEGSGPVAAGSDPNVPDARARARMIVLFVLGFVGIFLGTVVGLIVITIIVGLADGH